MAFNHADLAAYVKQNAKTLIAKQLTTAQTADIIARGGMVLTEVKTSEKIGQMETDAILQDGAGCGFTPSGTTRFSEREVTVGKIKVEEALCLADLEAKYTQELLSAGARYDDPSDFDFNQFWIDRKIAQTGNAVEKLIWQGDKQSLDGQLNRIDGLIKLLSGTAGVVQANHADYVEGGAALAKIDATNIMKAMDAIFLATPEEIIDGADMTYFIGSHWFRFLKLAIRNSNYFHYDPQKDRNIIYVPGSEMKIQRVNGLNGKNHIFGIRLSNIVAGTDLLDDFTNIKVWFDENTELVKYSNKFKYGLNVGFTEEVVEFSI
ncbi:MAG: hypothetical protein EOP49_32740 [Sphingobacteriales bacterium]|nr:MAG: hypothetical protein EOP49_32740 [Sphingobacteriales bacterium]